MRMTFTLGRRLPSILVVLCALALPAALFAQTGVGTSGHAYINGSGELCIVTCIAFWSNPGGNPWVDSVKPDVWDDQYDPETAEPPEPPEEPGNPDPHGFDSGDPPGWEPITPQEPHPWVYDNPENGNHMVKWCWEVCYQDPPPGGSFTTSWKYKDAQGNWQSATVTVNY
jgi:hypothetical protein